MPQDSTIADRVSDRIVAIFNEEIKGAEPEQRATVSAHVLAGACLALLSFNQMAPGSGPTILQILMLAARETLDSLIDNNIIAIVAPNIPKDAPRAD